MPALSLSGGINDGISSSRGLVDGGNSRKKRETMPGGEALAPTSRVGGGCEAEAEAEVEMPHYLAMVLRGEMDVSCRLGCNAAVGADGRMENGGGSGGQEAEEVGAGACLSGTDV